MLQTHTVSKELWQLLQQLMEFPEFNHFNLVGGTSLSLRRGYRSSIDIDLFTQTKLDTVFIQKVINDNFSAQLLVSYSYMLQFLINGVKVDFVNNGIHNIYPVENIQGIRIASELDVAALKLNAICGRGAKKDFVDIFVLLQNYKLGELLNIFQKKIPKTDIGIVLKSLVYFDDAESDKIPELFIKVKWNEIKKEIEKHVLDFFKNNTLND